MGISIESWRARIGCFIPTRRHRTTTITRNMSWTATAFTSLSLCIRVTLFLLLVVQGIESNPGPPRKANGNTKNKTDDRDPNEHYATNSQPDRQSHRQTRRSKTTSKDQSKISHFLNRDQGTKKKTKSKTPNQPQYNSDIEYETTQDEIYEYRSSSSESDSDSGSNLDMKTILLDIRKDVKTTNRKLDRLEQRVDDLKQENRKLKEENKKMQEKMGEMDKTMSRLESLAVENEKRNEHLEAQSRRENLRFFNINENGKNESWEESESKVRQYIEEELEMDPNEISIERAHRLPSKTTPRPIIVKFSFYKTKDTILNKYREKVKERRQDQADGQNNHVRISEDFVKRVSEVRGKLLPFMKESISNGQWAKLKYDKLVIEGVTYEYDYVTKKPVPI